MFPQHWNGDVNTFIQDLDSETKCCYFLSAGETRGFTQITCSAGNSALVSVFLCYFIFVQKLKLLGQKFKESLVNLPRFTVSGLFFLQFLLQSGNTTVCWCFRYRNGTRAKFLSGELQWVYCRITENRVWVIYF